jgi:hypothetical protein
MSEGVMNYVEEVSQLFKSRCNGPAIVSPEDYALIAEWEKQEIPFDIVLVTINLICDQMNGSETEINSIRYFNDAIKTNFRRWLQIEDHAPSRRPKPMI